MISEHHTGRGADVVLVDVGAQLERTLPLSSGAIGVAAALSAPQLDALDWSPAAPKACGAMPDELGRQPRRPQSSHPGTLPTPDQALGNGFANP